MRGILFRLVVVFTSATAILFGSPAQTHAESLQITEFLADTIPIWGSDGTSKTPVNKESFGSGPWQIKEQRNGYYLIQHPSEGEVFVPPHSVELNQPTKGRGLSCDVIASYQTEARAGLNAGERCPR